jgi:hypothetical protein
MYMSRKKWGWARQIFWKSAAIGQELRKGPSNNQKSERGGGKPFLLRIGLNVRS